MEKERCMVEREEERSVREKENRKKWRSESMQLMKEVRK